MTPAQEKELALRGKRAHERMHGQSTWIEARCLTYSTTQKTPCVRVSDKELGIITYWDVTWDYRGRPRIRFSKQYGERR